MTGNEKLVYEQLYEMIAEHTAGCDRAAEAQIAVWEDRGPAIPPLLLSCDLPPDVAGRFPYYHPGETHNDKVKMLLDGMRGMLHAALAGGQAVPSIRANMGCGIIPSMFPGIAPMLFDDGNMPWIASHLSGDEIQRLQEDDIGLTDEFKMAMEHMAYMAEHIRGTGAYVFPVDIQGPFDVAHLVYGDAIFYAMYDEPKLVHHLLNLSCHAIELGFSECLRLIPGSDKVLAHYNELVIPRSRGGIKLSEDTSTLISPEHMDEFVVPYTQRILDFAGGGYIHYCGRNDHLFNRFVKLEKVHGINFGNPEMHDMDDILRQVAQSGKLYYGTVHMLEGENITDYFRRVRTAATHNGRCRLLLSYWAEYDKIDETLAAWGC